MHFSSPLISFQPCTFCFERPLDVAGMETFCESFVLQRESEEVRCSLDLRKHTREVEEEVDKTLILLCDKMGFIYKML